jgi:hypothetical protein
MAINLKSLKKSQIIKAPRILLYGVAGIGKSTAAASADGVIYHAFEDPGPIVTTYLADDQNQPIRQDWDTIIADIGEIYEQDHPFKTYAADSLSSLERIIWTKTCKTGDDKGPRNNIEDFGYGKGYVYALDYWKDYLNALDMIRNDKDMPVLLLAHSEAEKFHDPLTDSYDRYRTDLHKAAAKLVYKWADCILFVNYATYTKKEDLGFNKTKVRGTGAGERVVYTSERPAYLAKNRYNLPDELPLDWSAIMTAIQNGTDPAAQAA